MALRLALFEPDIPQNTGTLMRLGACLGVGVDIIEPCGFTWTDRSLKRAGMDYLDRVEIVRHDSLENFAETLSGSRRLILLTARARTPYTEFRFGAEDTLLLGRESAGAPDHVHEMADARVTIPMAYGLRSLNVAVAAAMVVGEALRQTNTFPDLEDTRDVNRR